MTYPPDIEAIRKKIRKHPTPELLRELAEALIAGPVVIRPPGLSPKPARKDKLLTLNLIAHWLTLEQASCRMSFDQNRAAFERQVPILDVIIRVKESAAIKEAQVSELSSKVLDLLGMALGRTIETPDDEEEALKRVENQPEASARLAGLLFEIDTEWTPERVEYCIGRPHVACLALAERLNHLGYKKIEHHHEVVVMASFFTGTILAVID
jgi:hypothetical protein